MNDTSAHPPIEDLAAFIRGNLTEEQRVAVEQHIDSCDSCCEKMAEVPEDTWVDRMRQAETAFDGKPSRTAQDLSLVLDEQARYRLVKKLGEGGMGEVYLAEHRLMERLVALKVIRGELVNNSAAIARFRQEVKAAAKLSHRGIVTAHDAEEAGGLHFLVMEYVDGTSLDEVVARRGRLPVMHACNYIRQAAIALQHAHEHGMVHRDVKPQNLMLSRRPNGVVKVLDLGLTRIADQPDPESCDSDGLNSANSLTVAGATIGTPDYMAPEQVRDSRQADIRSDIYSLGCTLYFLLSGRPPFPHGTLAEKLADQIECEPTPLSQLRDDIPDSVVQIVTKMMAKEPAARYQIPVEVADALASFAKPVETESSPTPPPVVGPVVATPEAPAVSVATTLSLPRRSSASRSRVWVAGAVCLALIVGLVALAVMSPARPQKRVLFVVPSQYLCYEDVGPVRELLEENGYTIRFASTGTRLKLSTGDEVDTDYLLDEVNPDDYDALVCTGGTVAEFMNVRSARRVREIVQAMSDGGKPVAAIALGQQILAKAGAFQGKRVAFRADIEELVPDSGAIWVREPVVRTEQLITANGSNQVDRFASVLLEALSGQP